MRAYSVCGAVALLVIGTCGLASEGRAENEALLQASRAASKEFGAALKEQLMAGMKAGGPLTAIDVCHTAAGDIAAEMSRKHGVSLRRTALRVRNEANAPDAFEREALERFVQAIADGQDAATLEHSEIVSTESGKVFRYMKAIPTAAEPCLACHGSSIQPEVQARLIELYPNDTATGFKAGELRGAFSVSVSVP